MREKTAKIIEISLYVISAIIFIFGITNYLFIQELPNCKLSFDNFSSNNSYLLNVNGTSMSPYIKDGYQCICSKKERYEIGDVIVFGLTSGGEKIIVLHRIFEELNFTERTFATRGDKNNFTDSLIVPENAIFCSVETYSRINRISRINT